MTQHPTSPSKTILLAAGGTGGHIFPAEALAEALAKRGYTPHLLTDARFAQYNPAHAQGIMGLIPIHTLPSGNLGGNPLKKLLGALRIVRGTLRAWAIIRRTRPLAVVGFGGYPSFPPMVAALMAGCPTILHEQNSVLGKVNRTLAPRVRAIATTYPATARIPTTTAAIHPTGNPVRASIQALAQVGYPTLTEDTMLHLLVLGGSQGASVFGSVVPSALALLPEALRARIRVDQQCRAADLDEVRAHYETLGLQADLAPFFTDVAARLASAHLVISRAGASSVAELMVAGRPAILVPLPSAADNHQFFNAQAVQQAEAGWVIPQAEFTPELLAARLTLLLTAPNQLPPRAEAMRALAEPHAAERLADLVIAQAQPHPALS